MALNAYLKMTGQKQGQIVGGATQAGREGAIMVVAFNYEVISPRDAASGLPTGKRQHKPLVITKEIDRSTPLLAQALVTNEVLPSWKLDFWRASSNKGQEVLVYSIELVDANIAGIRQEMLDNRYAENKPLNEYEQIVFTFHKIVWTWTNGGITAMDDWESPTI